MSKRFTIWRNAIHCETYIVEADTEDEAIQQLNNGCHDPVNIEFVDWCGEYEIENVEIIDPLYKMIKEHQNG